MVALGLVFVGAVLMMPAMTVISRIIGLSSRALLLLSAGFSAAVLGAALVSQYGFGLHPCDLCIYQRIPYGLIIILGLGSAIFFRPRAQGFFVMICALLFLVDAGIASYHAGVEWGIFAGPTACASNSATGQTLEEIRAAILNAPLVSCAQAMATIFGLSMAAWNALVAFGAFCALSFVLYKRKHA